MKTSTVFIHQLKEGDTFFGIENTLDVKFTCLKNNIRRSYTHGPRILKVCVESDPLKSVLYFVSNSMTTVLRVEKNAG